MTSLGAWAGKGEKRGPPWAPGLEKGKEEDRPHSSMTRLWPAGKGSCSWDTLPLAILEPIQLLPPPLRAFAHLIPICIRGDDVARHDLALKICVAARPHVGHLECRLAGQHKRRRPLNLQRADHVYLERARLCQGVEEQIRPRPRGSRSGRGRGGDAQVPATHNKCGAR
eukprot:112575-Chlamydomonas_euryale.AAC.2